MRNDRRLDPRSRAYTRAVVVAMLAPVLIPCAVMLVLATVMMLIGK